MSEFGVISARLEWRQQIEPLDFSLKFASPRNGKGTSRRGQQQHGQGVPVDPGRTFTDEPLVLS